MSKPFSKKYAAFVLGLLSLKVTLIVSGLPASSFFASTFQLSDVFTSVMTDEKIVELTNQARKSDKVPPLKTSAKLANAAQEKADDIIRRQYFSHTTPDGKTPWNFMNKQKYYFLYAGENLAMKYDSAERVVESWMQSTAHRDNLLSKRYTEIGVGMARGLYQGNQTIVVVQMFGRPFVSPIRSMTLARQSSVSSVSDGQNMTGSSLGDEADNMNSNNRISAENLALITQIYFYAVLLLLAHITFRYFWLQHYQDRRLTFYTIGTFMLLASTITLF